MNLFYELAIHLLALIALPKVLYDLVKKGKYRKSLLKRFGKDFPEINKGKRKLFWVHAVSLGETRAIAPIIKKIKAQNEAPLILLSTSTETGEREGRSAIPEADYHVYLPLDFSYVIKPIVKRVRPDFVLITETDFWWNFQQAAKKLGAKLILINGKISEKSYLRLKKLPFLVKKLIAPFSLLCVQGPLYEKRFLNLGIPKEKIAVTGNIKLDNFTTVDVQPLKRRLGITPDDFVITCGSTHHPEEKIFLSAAAELLKEFPFLKFIIVPRHPERFEEVKNLIQIPFSCFSSGDIPPTTHVILMDVMGQLRSCYSLSQLAIVAGSFTPKVGGHNILEPCFYGVPVIFGPSMYSQPDFLDLIRNYRAGKQVTEESLIPTLRELIQNKNLREEMGRCGLKLIRESQGAVEKTINLVQKLAG